MTKAKHARRHAATLPNKPPKKTGRRGIGPKPDSDEPAKPRQARLPEMDDPKIEELETAAEKYAEIRDERMALTPQEKKLKDDLLAAMKRLNRTKYTRDGIEIKVVAEKETVKVRVKHTEETD